MGTRIEINFIVSAPMHYSDSVTEKLWIDKFAFPSSFFVRALKRLGGNKVG